MLYEILLILLALTLVLPEYGVEGRCAIKGLRAYCTISFLDEELESTAVINHCHDPIDVTFFLTYQYGNGTKHHWRYTYVTTNQNERIYIPGLIFQNVPEAPVFLYVRIPEDKFNPKNTSYVAILASYVATLKHNWEEADFLNETVLIGSREDCRYLMEQKALPWIAGGIILLLVLLGALISGLVWLQRKKSSLDKLVLVNNLEVGLPRSEPYQVSPEGTNTTEGAATTANGSSGQTNEFPKGVKGFRFRKLKEDKTCLGNSVVIGNPAFKETSHVQPVSIELKCSEAADEAALNNNGSCVNSNENGLAKVITETAANNISASQ